MKKAIEQCMAGFEAKESGELSAGFIFPEDFIGFQGHFPGNKILPGICQIQCALTMLERWRGEKAVLKEIISAKFFSPVLPAEELICKAGNIAEGNGDVILKASFSRDDKKVSEMKLRVQINQDKG
jgi:3-hydroxymyristoyl/3-hydroxydecanoyl-(acyl carrier protein) dehydratase